MISIHIKDKLKKLLAMSSAAGITLCSTGCFDYEKQNNDVGVQLVNYSSDVDGNVTDKPREYITTEYNGEDVSKTDEYISQYVNVQVTDNEKDSQNDSEDSVFEGTTTIVKTTGETTTTKPFVVVFDDQHHMVNVGSSQDINKNVKNGSDTKKGSTNTTTKPGSKIASVSNTDEPAQSSVTTVVTVTTTAPAVTVTEPPVIETEPIIIEPELPPVGESLLDKAMYDAHSNYLLAEKFCYDLIHVDGGAFSLIDMPYGITSGLCECQFATFALNFLETNRASVFTQGLDEYDAQDFVMFMCNFGYVQRATKKRIKFEEYVKNPEAADLLNQAQEAFFDNNFDYFMSNNMNSNIIYNPEYPGVNGILCGYDMTGRYYNEEDVINNYLNQVVDCYFETAYGHSFTK